MTEEALAQRLATARLDGATLDFPAVDLATGYAVARHLPRHLGPVLGWKIGATSQAAMAFLKIAAPIHGRLFAVHESGATIDPPGQRPLEAEPEILLTLGPDREPTSARFGVEFNRPSFAEPFALGAGAIVADNAASLGVLLGPAIALADLDTPHELVAQLNVDGIVMATGSADAVLGNPLNALAALRTALASDPRGLRPGDIIATGAMCRSVLVARGQALCLDAGRWGTATARLLA